MKTIALINNKGGVSKTTSTGSIAAYLSYTGKKVLMVDTDPQFNLTQSFNIYEVEKSIAHTYREYSLNPQEAQAPLIEINENLFLIPSSRELTEVEKILPSYNNNQKALKLLLKPFQDKFDYCFIDCPPSLGILTENAILASNDIIIPIEAAQFSISGITGIIQHLKNLNLYHESNINILGAFMSKYDERKSISDAVKNRAIEIFGNVMFNTVIRVNTALEIAQANGEDIFTSSKNSNSAMDYSNLTEEILLRLETQKVEA